MGQQNSSTSLKHRWQYIDTFGRFQVYKNELNELGQKHTLKCHPKIDQQKYLQIYNKRYEPTQPIVSIFDACYSKSDNDIKQSSTFTVFSQYIPYRLSNINKLTHGQGMYVLSQALAGFSKLYYKIGAFQINQDLVGFNKDGQVKVWHNNNFADNSIQHDKVILMSTKNPYNFDNKFTENQQLDMVQDIFSCIAKYTNFDANFISQLQYVRGLGFTQAGQLISNQINKRKYYVPDHINIKADNYILLKSGIRSKHQINKSLANVASNIKQKQSYPFFVGNQNQQKINHNLGYNQKVNDNLGYNQPQYYPQQYSHIQQVPTNHNISSIVLGGDYHNIDESRHIKQRVIPKQITSHHIIPAGRGVTYTTQQSIVHQLPAVRQDYYNQSNNTPRISHRHKIFQNQQHKIAI